MYILDIQANTLVESEIVKATLKDMPLKKDGWNFNWKTTIKKKDTETYVLRLKSNPSSTQGVLHLRKMSGMLFMDLVEIAPHNIGQKYKRYDYIAGCLIAFACRESFRMESNYKGFLSFESKTELTKFYVEKYYAKLIAGQNMYIEPSNGKRLIDEYLNRKNK